jgi:hypothetical protein
MVVLGRSGHRSSGGSGDTVLAHHAIDGGAIERGKEREGEAD